MRIPLSCLFFLLIGCLPAFAQEKELHGIITDKSNGQPLEFVNIHIKGTTRGFYSDTKGRFKFNPQASDSVLVISCVGYKRMEYPVNHHSKKEIIIALEREQYAIDELVVKPGKNLADMIMENVSRNRDKNNIEKRRSYAYTAYHRFFIRLKTNRELTEKDTAFTRNFADTLLNHMYLFLNETVTERKFLAPDRMEETVIANRVSGLKNSNLSVTGTQLQSFNFYRDKVDLLGAEYLSPAAKNNTKYYVFDLEDSVTEAGRKTYVIAFRPVKKSSFNSMNGFMHIDAENFGIVKIMANARQPVNKNSIQVMQRYTWIKDSILIPQEFTAEFDMNQIKVNAGVDSTAPVFNLQGFSRSVFSNVVTDEEYKKREFSQLIFKYDKDANSNDTLLDRYRYEPLTAKDSFTYHLLDSVIKAAGVERRLNRMSVFFSNKIPLGYVDIDVNRVFRINRYEGFRLGMGLSTSEKLAGWFTLSGYYGYGFKDKAHKYGGQLALHLSRKNELSLCGAYSDDVYESGGVAYYFADRDNLARLREIQVGVMDRRRTTEAWLESRLLNDIKAKAGMSVINDEIKNSYRFKDLGTTRFNITAINMELRWAFREKRVQVLNTVVAKPSNYPVVNFRYTEGIKTLGGLYTFRKFDIKVDKTFNLRPFARFNICAEAGYITDPVPYPFLYVGKGSSSERKYHLASWHCFEAMHMNEFLSDRYAALYLYYDFGRGNLWLKKLPIGIILRHAMMLGQLENADLHKNIIFTVPDKLYIESGLQLNTPINNSAVSTMGIGTFYRYGYYSFPSWKENIAIKLTISTTF